MERHHFRTELRKPFFLGAWGVLGSLLGAGRVVLLLGSVLAIVGELHLIKFVVTVSAVYPSHRLRMVKTGRVFPAIEAAISSLLRGGREE